MFPLRWLPDGSIVGFDDQQKIAVVDPATNRVIRSLDPGGPAVDVSPDLRDAAVFVDGQLSIVPIAGGKSLVEPIAVGGEWPRARFSPDGQRLPAGHQRAAARRRTGAACLLTARRGNVGSGRASGRARPGRSRRLSWSPAIAHALLRRQGTDWPA
jgi:hypothetical protein